MTNTRTLVELFPFSRIFVFLAITSNWYCFCVSRSIELVTVRMPSGEILNGKSEVINFESIENLNSSPSGSVAIIFEFVFFEESVLQSWSRRHRTVSTLVFSDTKMIKFSIRIYFNFKFFYTKFVYTNFSQKIVFFKLM